MFRTGTLQARTAEAWCSRTGTLQEFPDGDITGQNGRGLVFPEGDITGPCGRGLVFRTGTLQAQIPSTASDGLAPSAFDPSLEYSTDNVVLLWQPRPIFRSGRLRHLSSTACHILARSSL